MNRNFCTLLAALVCCLQLAAQPTITNFSPASAPVGTAVTINGTNFSAVPANNIVYFGAVKASVSAASATSLTVSVPYGATYRPITVTVNALTAYSNNPFVVNFNNDGVPLSNTFTQQFNLNAGLQPRGALIKDLDGDGKPDLINTRLNSGDITTWRNTSSGPVAAFTQGPDVHSYVSSNSFDVADLNGDGKPELMGVSGSANEAPVFTNTSMPGTISFSNSVSLVYTSSVPKEIIAHDMDADGKPDLVVSHTVNSFGVLRNQSTLSAISFAYTINFTTGGTPQKILVADIDRDGKPDVITLYFNQISIFRNLSTPGNISFAPAVDVAVDYSPEGLAIGDIDGGVSARPDLVTSRSYNGLMISVFRNISTPGTISFAASVDVPIKTVPSFIALNDMDGDGKTDVVFSQSTVDSVSVLRNISTAANVQFDPLIQLPVAGAPTALAIGDLDANGKPDIVTVNQTGQTLTVIRNLGKTPVIQSFTPTLAGPAATVTINGLNFTDASAVSFGGVPAASYAVINSTTIQAVVANGASGDVSVTTPFGTNVLPGFNFTTQLTVSSFTPNSGPVGTPVTINGANFSTNAADNIVYFGDVKANVLSATSTSLNVQAPAGTSFKPISVTLNGLTKYSAAPFKITFPGAAVNLLAKDLQPQSGIPTGVHAYKLASGDLDGDGKTDLVVTNSGANNFSVLRNTGTQGAISFAPKTDIATGNDPRGITVNDLDGDGMLDVALVNFASNTISVYRNTSTAGNISFAPKIDLITGASPQSIYAGDIDGDGKFELVTANNADGSVSVFHNTGSAGNISFDPKSDITVGPSPYAVLLADYNYDGKPELAVIYDAQTVAVFRNSSAGSISFDAPKTYNVPGTPAVMTSFDINSNGRPEIFVSAYTALNMYILTNTSPDNTIAFGAGGTLAAGAGLDICAADLDGDAKPDIVLPDENQNRIVALKNRYSGLVPFEFRFSQFAAGQAPVGIVSADFDGDGKPDVAVANYNAGSVSLLRNTVGEPVITGSGGNPVTGAVLKVLRMDSSVQVYNGRPYVQRHYDINPVNNPSTATATVTLYYLQIEFTNFNAHPLHGLSLPTGPSDNTGKANLRIYQFHGFSATGDPGTYPGEGVIIDPDDDKIVWNSDAQLWEVTIDVTGFSGFFAGSAGSSILPVNLISFNAVKQNNTAFIQWSTNREVMAARFELQRSTDGKNFQTISNIAATGNSGNVRSYSYVDKLGAEPLYYYRLKMIDRDGKFVYSNIAVLRSVNNNDVITVYPNPALSYVVVNQPVGVGQLRLIDMTGRVVRTVAGAGTQTVIDLGTLSRGPYKIVWFDGKRTMTVSLIKHS